MSVPFIPHKIKLQDLSDRGSLLRFYGWIMDGQPIYAYQRRVGYKFIIKTVYAIDFQQESIPVYATYKDLSNTRGLWEWLVKNKHKPSPVLVMGRKRGHRMYQNTKKLQMEASPQIVWLFLWKNCKVIPLEEGIPPEYLCG